MSPEYGTTRSTPGGIAGAIAGFAVYQWWATARPPYDAFSPHGLIAPQLVCLAGLIGLAFVKQNQSSFTRFIFIAATSLVVIPVVVNGALDYYGMASKRRAPDSDTVVQYMYGCMAMALLFSPIACNFASKLFGSASRDGAQ